MSVKLFSKYLIRTSEDYFLYLYLNDKNFILSDKFDKSNILLESKVLIDEPVTDFSVSLSNMDIIYLLYLNKYGELKYSKINNESISSNIITKLDLRSNVYSNLKLLTHKNSIHIFYSYQNYINSKICTIQHIIGSEGKWDKNTVISISTNENMQPFHVSFDKLDNIHLIYEAFEKNKQNIYYISYTPFLHKWNKTPYKLSEGFYDSSQSYLFIDTKDNVHVIWRSTCKNNNYIFQYRQSLALGNFQRTWKAREIPVKDDDFTFPTLFEEKGMLKIAYKCHNLIKNLYSQDYGYTWNLGSLLKCPDDIMPITYQSNIKSYNTKINRTYAKIADKITFFGPNEINLNDKNDIKPNIDSTNSHMQQITYTNDKSTSTKFDNEEILNFVLKTKRDINNIMTHIKPDIVKKDINSIISKNAKLLDRNIKYNKNTTEQITKNLEDLESLIKNYINYIKQIESLVNSIKENYENNIIDTKQILNQIDHFNKLIENEKNKSIFQKIIDLLK